jgi:signal transduction histidine kinase/DNA-binding LacI/PurR family transcriptional regulator
MSNQVRIGIGIGSGDVFWVQVNEAIYSRSMQHSVELIPIIRSNFSSALTSDERNALLEEIASQELDVVLGWSFPESLAYPVLDMGIPIVHLFETVVEHPLCVSPLGLQKIAEELAHYVAKSLNEKGNVLVIGGLLQNELPDDGRSRFRGVQKAFQGYPDICFHHLSTSWKDDDAYPQIYAALQKWPHPIDAIYGLSDSLALIGHQIGLELGCCTENAVVVGINGDPQALAAIIEERMTATVETSPTNLANQAFDIALKIASGQPYPLHYEYNPRLLTSANVARVAAEKLVGIASLPSRLVDFERNEQQEYQDYLETSLDISRQIGSVLDYQYLPVELARLIRTNYAYDHVQLFYWSAQEQILTLVEGIDSHKSTGQIPLLKAGVLGEALMQDKPIFIPDSQRSFRFAPDLDWPHTRSRVILPIRQGDKVLGLLDLHAFRVINCTRQHLMGLQSLADQIGVAIHNAQLYREALQAKITAEKADRLKSHLLANVSHELRNPLHIILNHAANLDGLSVSGDASQQIQTHASHLLRLINDLLDLSRAEIDELSITPEIIEPYSFLKEVFESIADRKSGDAQVC